MPIETSKRMFLAGAFALALAAGMPAWATAGDFSTGAKSFLQSLGDRVIEELTPKNIDRAERERRFRSILKEHFAVEAIGQWVLGASWRKANDAEKQEYLALFEDLVIATYVNRFENYKGETLSVVDSQMKGEDDALVYSHISLQEGNPPLKVDWRVRQRKSDGKFKIVDVIVEGISMSQTQRSEFASVIHKHGGEIAPFLRELRDRVKKAA
ncbi:MAG: ABC transporter substrate-binding protein [Magnetospirillum sp. WYHS-4]